MEPLDGGKLVLSGLKQNCLGGQVYLECSMAHLSPGLAPNLAIFKSKVFFLFYDPLCQNKDFSETSFPIRRNDTLPAGNFGYPENLVEDILQVWEKFGKGDKGYPELHSLPWGQPRF